MGLPNPFKLEKLKIQVYEKTGKEEDNNIRYAYKDTIRVMYNPTSYSRSFSNSFQTPKNVGGEQVALKHVQHNPEQISLELIIDSTGAADFGFETILNIGQKSVSEQIEHIKSRCLRKAQDPHDVNYLILEWGDLNKFGCHLSSMQVTYSLFDSSGKPLRAKVNLTFIETVSPDELKRRNELHSADITRARMVKMEDTLPQLTKDIYGSYDQLFFLARANDLDQFRKLTPGTQLIFPALKDK